jgi:hypothetical protein
MPQSRSSAVTLILRFQGCYINLKFCCVMFPSHPIPCRLVDSVLFVVCEQLSHPASSSAKSSNRNSHHAITLFDLQQQQQRRIHSSARDEGTAATNGKKPKSVASTPSNSFQRCLLVLLWVLLLRVRELQMSFVHVDVDPISQVIGVSNLCLILKYCVVFFIFSPILLILSQDFVTQCGSIGGLVARDVGCVDTACHTP